MNNFPINELLDIIYPRNNSRQQNRNVDIPVDSWMDEKTIYIYADLPGVDKEKINIDFYNNLLTITANKTKRYDNGTNNMYQSEITYGNIERQINLPICVTRSETVSVNYKDGQLCIKINKMVEEENKFSVKVSQ